MQMLTSWQYCLIFPISKKNRTPFSNKMLKFAKNERKMEQEIKDISIERIQQLHPDAKGIANDLLVDYTEHYIVEGRSPIYK